MSEIASAFVSLMPSAKGFGSSMNRQIGPQIDSSAKKSGTRFGKVFAYSSMNPLKAIGAAAVGLFAVREIKDFFGSAISEARESQKVSALTAQVIKSTGGAAGISAKQVGDLAGSISNLTGIDDEAIQGGENLLLTFTNLKNGVGKGNDIFNQATRTITDMSAALGQDMKSSAIQVGKALNDPIKGVTALSRVGVSFTEGQKATIKSLVDGGNVMGAQKIILGELKKEFGGAAAASATAGEKFHTAFANFQEAIGTALLPYLDRALTKGAQFVQFLTANMGPAFARIKQVVAPVAAVIGDAFSRIGDLVQQHLQPFFTLLSGVGGAALASFVALIGGTLVSALGVLVGALASPVAIIGALAGAAIYAYTHFEGFRVAVDNLIASLKANLLPVLQAAATTFQTVVLPAITALASYVAANFLPVLRTIAGVITGQVLPIISSLGQFLYGQLYPAILSIVVAVGSKLKPVFDQYVATLRGQILPAVQSLLAKFREHQPAIQAAVLAVAKIIGKVLEFAAAVLAKVLPVAIRFQGFMAGQFIRGIGTAIGVLVEIVKACIKVGQQFAIGAKQIADFVKAVVAGINKANTVIASLPGKVKAALAGMYEAGKHAAEELIRGLVSGLLAGVGKVKDAVSSVASAIKDHFPGSPVKTGPLLSWNNGGAGKRLVGMLADGLTTAAPTAAAAAEKVANAVRDHLEKMRDKVKSIVDGLKSDFASLSDSVASAFSGDALSAHSASGFFDRLINQQDNLKHLRAAFQKLLKWGIDPKFLSALFQSGNQALIFDLADGTKTQALVDSQIFTANQSIANSLGNSVAQADIGPELRRQTHRLDQIEDHLKHLPKHIGQEINGAATAGHKGRAA